MAPGTPAKQSNTSLMYFFAVLGLLLLVSTLVPSCHSRQSQWLPWHQAAPDPKDRAAAHYSSPSPTPPPTKSATSPTPPAKPATPPTPPPPPPHH